MPSSRPQTTTSRGTSQLEASKVTSGGSISASPGGLSVNTTRTAADGADVSTTWNVSHVPDSLTASGPSLRTSRSAMAMGSHAPEGSHVPDPAQAEPSKQSSPSPQLSPLAATPPSSSQTSPPGVQRDAPDAHPTRQLAPSTHGVHAPAPSHTPLPQGSPAGRRRKGSQLIGEPGTQRQ